VHVSPALYRTRTTHLRRAPAYHYFEHHGYSWYVDVDRLPELPRWFRPFARFDPRDHLVGGPEDSLRRRVESFLGDRGIDVDGGRITALMQPRVLGYGFTPMTLYWCHDRFGVVRHIVMELHNTGKTRHAYLLPPGPNGISLVPKEFRISPFNGSDGYYLVEAPRPAAELDVRMSLHRDDTAAFVVTMRGEQRRISTSALLRLQLAAPFAPLMAGLEFRVQKLVLRLRGVPVASSDQLPETGSRTGSLVAHAGESRML
jgi:DUF1365 family protein